MKLHWTRRLAYTLGVEEIAEAHGAYWLIDLVASHQPNPQVACESFQVWTLTVAANNSAVARMTDGNDGTTPIIEQSIEFTDYPPEGVELWCVLGEVWVLMTPDEY